MVSLTTVELKMVGFGSVRLTVRELTKADCPLTPRSMLQIRKELRKTCLNLTKTKIRTRLEAHSFMDPT